MHGPASPVGPIHLSRGIPYNVRYNKYKFEVGDACETQFVEHFYLYAKKRKKIVKITHHAAFLLLHQLVHLDEQMNEDLISKGP